MDFNDINKSDLISRDLSWLNFNLRVLDQVKNKERNILERLRFLSIVASNFDEFFEVRVGSLYNYIDSNKKRIDYSREFFDICNSTKTDYAIPFASNMACLHKETFQYNEILYNSKYTPDIKTTLDDVVQMVADRICETFNITISKTQISNSIQRIREMDAVYEKMKDIPFKRKYRDEFFNIHGGHRQRRKPISLKALSRNYKPTGLNLKA